MLVQAAPGTRCPKEENPRKYIDDKKPQDVPDSAYYTRLVADESLVVAEKKNVSNVTNDQEKRTKKEDK